MPEVLDEASSRVIAHDVLVLSRDETEALTCPYEGLPLHRRVARMALMMWWRNRYRSETHH